jgi:dipeptidyl aminopeptidase/acylaminoacyl peptidase
MRRTLPAFLLVVLLAGSPGMAAPVPLEVYGSLPRLENLALSPDGERIAFVKTDGDTRIIAILDIKTSTPLPHSLRMGENKLRGIRWADNERLLITTSVTTVPVGFVGQSSEWSQMQVLDVRTGKVSEVPQADTFGGVPLMNAIGGQVMVRRLKDHTVLFVPGFTLAGNELARVLVRHDLDAQRSHIVKFEHAGSLGWVVDEAGEVAAEETWNESDRRWTIYFRRDGRMERLAGEEQAIEFPEVLGWGPNADALLVQMMLDGDPVWRLLSLKDGTLGEPMAGSDELNSPIEHPLTNRMIGGVRVDDVREYVFFDPGVRHSWQAVTAAFKDEHVDFESASEDFNRMIVKVEGPKYGYRFVLVDLASHRAHTLGNVYDGLTQPLPVQRISYAAADGLKIPAYLTLPPDKAPRSLPLVVLPHGGPAARDTANFDWWAQALAAQGYAVLQPNYRGSLLSWKFQSAGFGEWGRKMQSDLSDGVRFLVKQGQVDPARVCIVGASYGGYAALAGVSLESGVYRCAVSVAGVSDIRRMLEWVNSREGKKHNITQRYWDRYMGVSGPDDPAAASISPAKHAAAVTVPVLLIHGKDDTVVPFDQSKLMFDALRDSKKDVQLIVLKNEDHWLSRSLTRLQMLQSSVEFLRAHNPPD